MQNLHCGNCHASKVIPVRTYARPQMERGLPAFLSGDRCNKNQIGHRDAHALFGVESSSGLSRGIIVGKSSPGTIPDEHLLASGLRSSCSDIRVLRAGIAGPGTEERQYLIGMCTYVGVCMPVHICKMVFSSVQLRSSSLL